MLASLRKPSCRLVGSDGSQQTSGGLRVEQQIGFASGGQFGAIARLSSKIVERMPLRSALQSPGHQRDGLKMECGTAIPTPRTFPFKMPGQTKPGDVGHRVGVGQNARRASALWLHHLPESIGDPCAIGLTGHFSGHQYTAADGFGQDQRISGSAAGQGDRFLSHRPVRVKPMVISSPIELWPPTISAPAVRMTSLAVVMISVIVRCCSSADMRGRMIVAVAACGARPHGPDIAQARGRPRCGSSKRDHG